MKNNNGFFWHLGEISKCCYRPLHIFFPPSALYIQTLVCSMLTCINSYCSATCQDIQTLRNQNYLLCVVPRVLLSTWGTADAVRSYLGLFSSSIYSGWELSLKPKFQGKRFAHFFSLMPVFPKNSVSWLHKGKLGESKE